VPQTVLKEMIRQTSFAVSPDDNRPILTGILMVFDGETLKLVATDTHRLAVKTAIIKDGRGSQQAIVPARAMNELTRLLSDAEGDVQVALSNNQVKFALPGDSEVQIVARLIEGQFPNFQRVIPQDFQKRLVIPTEPLLRAVRRAHIVARESANRVVLRTDGEKLVLTAESQQVGNAREELELHVREGDDVEIAFNAKYLLDLLNVLTEETLTMELSESLKPGLVRPIPAPPKDSDDTNPMTLPADYLCVLMPMQIV
jgi:DNA polymerase III subunit beta